MEILIAMVKIVAALLLGYFFYKIHILNDESNAVISKLVIYGPGTCMIFSSVVGLDMSKKGEVLTLVVAGIVLYIILAGLSFLAAKLLRPGKSLEGVYEALMLFGNSAFLAFPIGQAFMGDWAVSYLAILNVHQNIFAFSYGIYLLTKGNKGEFKFSFKKLINPGVLSAIFAIIMYFIGIQFPPVLMETVDFLGQVTGPFAMVIMGSMIAAYSLKELFNNWRYYAAAVFKMLVYPLVIFVIARAIWGSSDLTRIITLHVAMPTATIVSMLALANNSDAKTTSAATGLMNILCIGTIPGIWLLINALLASS